MSRVASSWAPGDSHHNDAPTHPDESWRWWTLAVLFGAAASWTILHGVKLNPVGLPGGAVLVLLAAVFTPLTRQLLMWLWFGLRMRRWFLWIATCIGIGLVLVEAIPVDLGASPQENRAYWLITLVAFSLTLGLIVFVAVAWLVTDPLRTRRKMTPPLVGKWDWVVFALPPTLIWSVYLLAFWPAVMSSDSIDQWGQLLSGRFNNWHPAFHSLTQWLLTRIVESPAVVAATQIAVLSSTVGWALASMRRLGMSNYLAWIISAAVALMPANGITVITLWKDVPYAIAVLALGVIILREVDGRLSLLDKPWGWLLVGAVAALLALFHHAGVAIAAVSLGTLGLAVRRKAVIGATLVAVVVVGLVQGGLYRVLGVERIEHPGVDSVVIHHIGAHLAADTPLTTHERSVLLELIPIPDGDWYDCRSVDGFVFHPAFSVAAMHERASEGRALWWSLFTRDPKVDFEHKACSSSFVWRIRLLPGSYWYPANLAIDQNNIVTTIAPNEFGLELDPILPELTYPLARMISKSQDPVTAWLLWRGAVPLYLLLIGAAVASLRSRNWRYWIVIAPSGTVAAVLTFAAPTQDFRYMYPVFLSAMLLAPYLLFAVGHNAGSKALQVRSPGPHPL